MNMITQIKSRIVFNREITPKHFHLSFNAPRIAGQAEPGQFVHIRVSDCVEPLLRRPFSVHRIRGQGTGNRGQVEILYKVVGKGTEILSQRKSGEYLDIIGPLGNGFNYQPIAHSQQPIILVAGGMGVAPLLFLAEKLEHQSTPRLRSGRARAPVTSRHIVLIGARRKNSITCEKEFQKLGFAVKIATEDGSRGFKGRVTELLKNFLPLAISHKPLAIYACGPHPMLKEVAAIARRNKIPCEVSLEELFACGVGACLGCAVKVKATERANGLTSQRINGTYKFVCKDGPVFDAGEILW